MEQKLMYLVGETANFVESPYGYEEIYGIEKYNGAVCRNKAVFRLDMLYGLLGILSEDTIRQSRGAVYRLISGHIQDMHMIAEGLKLLYATDMSFRRWLGESLYFDGVPESQSLYGYFIECVRQAIDNSVGMAWDIMESYASCYMMHQCYMYVFIPDMEFVATVPSGFEEEVVSSAKVWSGHFKKK